MRCLNRADPRGPDNAEAEAAIAETIELVLLRAPLGSRKAFGNAASKGLAVTELKGTDGKASQEMMALYVEITKQGATT